MNAFKKSISLLQGIVNDDSIAYAKKTAIVSFLEEVNKPEFGQIRSSSDAYIPLSFYTSGLTEEHFFILCLNRANKVVDVVEISKGGMTGTVADKGVIFREAIKRKACSIILAHNHPSGNTIPSQADIELTKSMKDAGDIMDIPVLDHLICTDNSYYSFADEGML